MDREGFKNRLKQYKEAKGFDPLLKYWEWKQKYDSAPQPDAMPSQPQSDLPTVASQPLDNRAHRWDNEHYVDPVNTVFDADRHRSWKEPALKTFGKRVKFTYRDFMKSADVKHMKFLQSIGRLGNTLKGASIFGEVAQNLFPSEEAELIEDLRVKMDKQNKLLTGLEDIPMYDEGTDGVKGKSIPTQEEYIAEQIAAKKAAALAAFRNATEPVLPIINGQPNVNSCIYTALNMYGKKYATPGNWTFYDNPGKHGFKQKELSKALPSDLIQVFDGNKPYHMMMLDGYDEQGYPLYNYSRGMKGDSSDIVKAKTNFPNTKKLAYEFVGTPADSTQWINDYKKIYGFADGGEVNQRQLILNRANEVSTNYSDAKDFTLDPINYTIRKLAKTLFGRGGISNCTLSATRWVDPNNQYMSAKNIFNNPNSGYTEISKDYVLPGDLLITKVPNKDSYHTMLVEGFDGDEPILRYSKGGHDTENNLVTGRTLSLYHKLDKEQGGNHDEDHYFRYNLPNEYWLPEITVTPKK